MKSVRQVLLAAESRRLAPWAQRTSATAGRLHPEAPHPFRTDYQRDCARIIHSRAFRRLELKTQVFLSGSGDHLRNRLTHTIEVASVSRTIARALRLNEDLAEAIALAHDLGHPPFGHSGEETLNALMRGHGGFEHNIQSLRVVEMLESKYPGVAGLNLSFEVLEGLRKHDRSLRAPDGTRVKQLSLEAQVANVADEIAYYSHDLEDGLDNRLLKPGDLEELRLWREVGASALERHPGLAGRLLHTYVVRCLIDREVEDVISTSAAGITASGVRSAGEVRRHPTPLIRASPEVRAANRELRAFLYKNLYHHPRVAGRNRRACRMLEQVFRAFEKNPARLGRASAARVEEQGLHRTICDYLSGMTDRYLIAEHQRIVAAGRKR